MNNHTRMLKSARHAQKKNVINRNKKQNWVTHENIMCVCIVTHIYITDMFRYNFFIIIYLFLIKYRIIVYLIHTCNLSDKSCNEYFVYEADVICKSGD